MTKKFIQDFKQFINTIDNLILDFIRLNDNSLTKNISSLQWQLWKYYKVINGNSAGFHGISEYIVFSAFKNFIEENNKPHKFEARKNTKDNCIFKLENKSNSIIISRGSRKHIGFESKRSPDITILRKEKENIQTVTVIEIKNILDKQNVKSAINILSDIQNELNEQHIKYSIFSFSSLSLRDKETLNILKLFADTKNNFMITNEEGNEELGLRFLKPQYNKNKDFNIIDLSQFFKLIKDDIKI